MVMSLPASHRTSRRTTRVSSRPSKANSPRPEPLRTVPGGFFSPEPKRRSLHSIRNLPTEGQMPTLRTPRKTADKVKAEARSRWDRLTDEDFDSIKTNVIELATRLQARYDLTADEAKKQ